MIVAPVPSRTRSPRRPEKRTSTRPPGVTPTARAAATAASVFIRLWAWSNGSSSSIRSPPAITTCCDGGASGTEPPRQQRLVARHDRRRPVVEPDQQLRLGLCDALQRAHLLQVHGADIGDHG